MNALAQMQTPEAATRLIKRRDKAVFEAQSALQMLGKYDTGNEMNLIHLSSEDLRRLEEGLERVRKLLEYVSTHIEPFDSKLASKLLAYKAVLTYNTAGFSDLGKTRAMLHRVGKDLEKMKTYTSPRDVEASTKMPQHRPKTATSTPSVAPRLDVVPNPGSTQDDDASNTTDRPDLHPEIWYLGSESSITSRTLTPLRDRSTHFVGPSKNIKLCLKHRPNTIRIIHAATHSTLPDASGDKSSNEVSKGPKERVVRFQALNSSDSWISLGKDEKGKGRADEEFGDAGTDLHRSSVNVPQHFATPAEARPLPPIPSQIRPMTEKRNAWGGILASPTWQAIMRGEHLAQAEQEVHSEPVAKFSLAVLPAATDEASYMQLSNVDIVEFAVVDADRNPVTGFTWIASSPPGSLKTHDGECTTIVRNHAAAKLKADPRAICLWFTVVFVELNGSGFGDTATLSKYRVNVFLDPYIRLIVGNAMHIVDYSKRMTTDKIPVNRACVLVGELRKQAYTQSSIHKKQRFKLCFQGITLDNNKAELRDACSLSQRILQGWDPLYINVDIERKRDCVVCGDELSLWRFSHSPITSACSHECHTCRKCVREWIKSSLNNNGPDKLTCTECPSVLQHADVKTHASSRQFER